MTLRKVTVVTDPADPVLDTLHALGQSSYDPAAQCSPGAFWPSGNDLTRCITAGGSVYYTGTATTPTGYALADKSGQILWLKAPVAQVGPSCAAIASTIYTRCGACWGTVANDTLRPLLAKALPAHVVDDGRPTCRVWWKP